MFRTGKMKKKNIGTENRTQADNNISSKRKVRDLGITVSEHNKGTAAFSEVSESSDDTIHSTYTLQTRVLLYADIII